MSLVGKKNVYTCKACLGSIVTIDLEEGVTPFNLRCRVLNGCIGLMVSHMYKVDPNLTPEYEWVRGHKWTEDTPLSLRRIGC